MQESSIYIDVSSFRGLVMFVVVLVPMIMFVMIVTIWLMFMWFVIIILMLLTL